MNAIKHPACLFSEIQFSNFKGIPSSTDVVIQRGYQKLVKATPVNYVPQILRVVDIGPFGVGKGHIEWTKDCTQCYQQVLMWLITGNEAHAHKANELVFRWSTECESFVGGNAPPRDGVGDRCNDKGS